MKFGIKASTASKEALEKALRRKEVCILTIKMRPIWEDHTTDRMNRAAVGKFALRCAMQVVGSG